MGVRTLLLVKLLFVELLGLASPEDAPPEGQSFVFLGHLDKAVVDERLLLDAVAIYTRDLGIALLQSPGKAAPALSPGGLDDVAALLRSRGARLAFWCQPAAGGHQIELVTVDPRRTVGRYVFDADGPSRSDLYRSMALRLRAVLTGVDANEPGGGVPPPFAAPPLSPAPPIPAPPRSNGPVEAPAVPAGARQSDRAADKVLPRDAARDTGKGAPPERLPGPEPAAARPSEGMVRLLAGAGYTLSYPLGTSASAGARNALALDVMVATRGHLEWDFGTDLAPSASRTSAMATISVTDIPFRLTGRWMEQIGAFSVGAGPFLGLHWLSASASSGTQTDQHSTAGGSAGLDLVARGPAFFDFAPQLRVWTEINVPRTRFTIEGVPHYDEGAVRLGLNVEIVAPAH